MSTKRYIQSAFFLAWLVYVVYCLWQYKEVVGRVAVAFFVAFVAAAIVEFAVK